MRDKDNNDVQDEGKGLWAFVAHLLHRVLYELVKTIKLLTNKALLLKVRAM